jgi:hypothetical protein
MRTQSKTRTKEIDMEERLHVYVREEIVRSVLLGEEITARCGHKQVCTREGMEKAAAGELKPCKKCSRNVGEVALTQDVTLHKPNGWLDALEATTRELLTQPKPARWTVKFNGTESWPYTDGSWPPPAA